MASDAAQGRAHPPLVRGASGPSERRTCGASGLGRCPECTAPAWFDECVGPRKGTGPCPRGRVRSDGRCLADGRRVAQAQTARRRRKPGTPIKPPLQTRYSLLPTTRLLSNSSPSSTHRTHPAAVMKCAVLFATLAAVLVAGAPARELPGPSLEVYPPAAPCLSCQTNLQFRALASSGSGRALCDRGRRDPFPLA